MRRFLSIPPLLLASSLLLLYGCGQDRSTTIESPPSSVLATVSTELGPADIIDFHNDSARRQLAVLVAFTDSDSRSSEPIEFYLGAPALGGLSGQGFSASVKRQGEVSRVAMAVHGGDSEAPELEFAWNQGTHELRSKMRVDAESGSLHREFARDGVVVTGVESSHDFAKLVRPNAGDHREELLALLASVDFRHWLVSMAGAAAGRGEDEIQTLYRWTDDPGWQSVCDWANVGALATGWCVWNPVCAGVYVPSISVSVACGLVSVIETVGDWFNWWDD